MPTRHKKPVVEEQRLRAKTTTRLYAWQNEHRSGPLFVLHDGPPYANGNLHMGHALNKVLKDFINRYKLLRGHRIHFVPGWDCHGLPIEQKALSKLTKKHTELDPIEIRRIAKAEALEAIVTQKQEFLDLGIMADWDSDSNTYRSLDHDFEMRELKLFERMVERRLVAYRKRPTYFSPASRTALAESELTYREDHQSRSIYVAFEADTSQPSPGLKAALSEVQSKTGGDPTLKLVIWTTTPWSLPGNAGVAINKDAIYEVVSRSDGQALVIMQDRRPHLEEILGPCRVLATIRGEDLIGTPYYHPFHGRNSSERAPVVFHSDNVSSSSGTGLVHSAPAHGHDDYTDFQALGLLPDVLRSPIDDSGCFTAEVGQWSQSDVAGSLIGEPVLGKGTALMIDLLGRDGWLLAEAKHKHKYPYDWKSHTPVIVRATSQWFVSLESLRSLAIDALDKIAFHPAQSRQRLESFLQSRAEWCISRQRSWGVPIPVLFDSDDRPILDRASLSHNISVLKEKGADHWWSGPIRDFAGNQTGAHRSMDTLDVWFDSGSTWTLLNELDRGVFTADVCLEGSDQHRGWFQSQLFTLLAQGEGRLPYKSLITHGFILDEKGSKMSKSAGNGLSPSDIVHGVENKAGYGADALRLWAASVDYQRDVTLGQSSLTQAAETLRRLRSVSRFLVGVTGPYSKSSSETASKFLLDRYILDELASVEREVAAAYESFAFNRALNAITTFCASTTSTLYFDVIKDILYCNAVHDPRRAAALQVCRQVLQTTLKMMAPLVPHLAEEVHEAWTGGSCSVFEEVWTPRTTSDEVARNLTMPLLRLRQAVINIGEVARTDGSLGQLSEADMWITGSGSASQATIENLLSNEEIIPVSQIKQGVPPSDRTVVATTNLILGDDADYEIKLTRSVLVKCPRCWKHRSTSEGQLCARCQGVVVME